MNKKKYFAWLIALLLSMFSANAQYKMHVNMKNGSTFDVFVSEIESITWDFDTEGTTEPVNNGKTVISASIENKNNSTRTVLKGDDTRGYDVVWSSGDQFTLGGQNFTLESGEGTPQGTFIGTLPEDDEYTVYYPSTYDGTTWPSYQTYTANNIMGLPMTASVTIKDGKVPASVNFTYVGGILRLIMRHNSEDQSVSVKNITVKAQELSDPIVLDCGTGVALTSEGVPFYIAMPAGNYNDVTIQVMDTDGAVCEMKLRKGMTLDITRSHIITASFAVSSFVSLEYVDLGLSVKWATCNVGASSPEEYGDYYAWGETETKSTYNWSTYKWCKGSETTLTKYCTSSSYGTVDNKKVLESSDDVAQVKWGGSWRMPTDTEMTELRENCTWTWTTQGGKNGYKVTSKKNGNSIFLPAAGCRGGSSLNNAGSSGDYWSSSLDASNPSNAWNVHFNSSNVSRSDSNRYCGEIRAACLPVVPEFIFSPRKKNKQQKQRQESLAAALFSPQSPRTVA